MDIAAATGSGRKGLAPSTWVLLALALVFALGAKDGAGSWADASRLATIESLAERGTLSIDQSTYFWQGDKVRFDGRYYSHQPPMLAILGAGPYALLHRAFGLSIDDPRTYRILTVCLVGLPLLAGLWALRYLLRRAGAPEGWVAVLVGLSALGTLLLPYGLVLNQHGTAAGMVLLGLGAIASGRPWLAGFALSLATAIDLTAVFFALALTWPVVRSGGPRGALAYVLGALPAAALHAGVNWRVAGDLLPFGMHVEAFRYPLSPFLLQSLTGAVGEEPRGVFAKYAFEASFGQSGLFSFHPWLLLCVLAGLGLLVRRRRFPVPGLLSAVAVASLGIAAYYLTQSRNLGGSAFGMRWFAVFAPTLALFLGTWIAPRDPSGAPLSAPSWAKAGFAVLALWSVLGAALGAVNPWAKFHFDHASSPLGLTGAEAAPQSRLQHWKNEWRRIQMREPITKEVYEARYGVLIDQHRRFYLQPTPWLDESARIAFVERGIEPLREVARTLDEDRSTSELRPLAHFWVGKLQVAAGRREEAALSYRQALELRPSFHAAQTALSQLERGELGQ